MKLLEQIEKFYFIGVGGIGMSALARYFAAIGCEVAGYDRAESALTLTLAGEGVAIHYQDDPSLIPSFVFDEPDKVLVVVTPAIPDDHSELNFLKKKGYEVMKRARLLGLITANLNSIAVAGTHGKTTISTMIAHLMYQSENGCNAFLGGIAKNYLSNLLIAPDSQWVVAEADEYDRSFLNLHPDIALITSIDPDHLDVYGDEESVRQAFSDFVSNIKHGGKLITKKGLYLPVGHLDLAWMTYAANDSSADFYADGIEVIDGAYHFNFVAFDERFEGFKLDIPGMINLENAVGALAAAFAAGLPGELMKKALASFEGVKRRLDIQIKQDDLIFIDDYAHHPHELEACIDSVKSLYKDKKVTGVFQPHLFSRTRDFASGFAKSLDLLDEIVVLDIYPAREKPVKGVSADIIFDKITNPNKQLCRKEELLEIIKNKDIEVLLTMGAGDIDQLVSPLKNLLEQKRQQV